MRIDCRETTASGDVASAGSRILVLSRLWLQERSQLLRFRSYGLKKVLPFSLH